MPGAAPAGVDLRLHDIDWTGETLGDFLGFLRRIGDAAFRDCHAEFLQQAFRLILMDVHVGKTLSREWFGANDGLGIGRNRGKVKMLHRGRCNGATQYSNW